MNKIAGQLRMNSAAIFPGRPRLAPGRAATLATRFSFISLLMFTALLAPASIFAQVPAPPAADLEKFFDEFLPGEPRQAAGRVAVYVSGDETVLRVYGRTDSNKPIDVDRTLLPLGNLTRILTAKALLETFEPQTDLRNHLATAAEQNVLLRRNHPLTLLDVLTESSGLTDPQRDLYFHGKAEPRWPNQLSFLQAHKVASIETEEQTAKRPWSSSAAFAIASLSADKQNGDDLIETLRSRTLPGLGLKAARFRASEAANGFTHLSAAPLNSHLPAANGLHAPARDVSALLRFLTSPASAALRKIERRPTGVAVGFTPGLRTGRQNNQGFLYRDTATPGAPGRLLLTPDGKAGLFVLALDVDSLWLENFTARFFDRFYSGDPDAGTNGATKPNEPNKATEPDDEPADELAYVDFIDPGLLVGTYGFAGRPRFGIEKFTGIFDALKVELADPETLSIKPEIAGTLCGLNKKTFFRQTKPGLLRAVRSDSDTPGRDIFIAYDYQAGDESTTAAGSATLFCDIGRHVSFERLAWHAYPGLHFRLGLLILGACLTLFLIGGRLRQDGSDQLSARLRRLARLTVGLASLTLVLLVPVVFGLGRVSGAVPFATGIPFATQIVLGAGLFTAGLASTLFFLTLRALFQLRRLDAALIYPLAAYVLSACFLALLFYWNLLGFQY